MDYEQERLRMVETQLVKRGIKDKRVLGAMRKVPRHLFMPEELRHNAYSDSPLPIGEGQTISQPYIVAFMTESLHLQASEKVLELGTGSGYQAALLAELVQAVYTVERIPELCQKAQLVLKGLGYTNIHFKIGDGTHGWPEKGPFDGIMVTAAAPEISPLWVEQLAEEGRMVVPVGPRLSQTLQRVTKRRGQVQIEYLSECVFVPLLGDYGYSTQNSF